MSLLLIAISICTINGRHLLSISDEDELKAFLRGPYEKNASQECYLLNVASYDFNIDVNNKDKENALVSVIPSIIIV